MFFIIKDSPSSFLSSHAAKAYGQFYHEAYNAGIERLPARNTQPLRNHTTLMRGTLAGSPLE